MNKKLFLSALFAGSMVVNSWAEFRSLDQLTEFAEEIMYNNPDIVMEDHLTIDALRNLDTETLVEAMDIIR